MITKKTVLILGAGASMDYGFPSGRELLQEIKEGISTMDEELYAKLAESEQIPDIITDLYEGLVHADPLSIDAFLERRIKYIHLGKLAIAFTLIPKEIETKLFNRKSLHWYQYLSDNLSQNAFSPEDFGNNQLAIITFNYDRSIEHYLYTRFQHTYGLKDDKEKCAEIIKKIPIIHVYGSLGPLPWQQKPGTLYGQSHPLYWQHVKTVSYAIAKPASDNIKIIPEAKDTSEEFDKAYEQLRLAKRIYFLGFGYHEANLRRLRMIDFKSKAPKGSCLGMAQTRLDKLKAQYDIKCVPNNVNNLDFLRNHAPLD